MKKSQKKNIPNSEISVRLEKFREKLAEKNIDAYLVTKKEDIRYLSGFTGSDSWLIINRKKQLLLTDFRYLEEAEVSAPMFNVEISKTNIIENAKKIIKKLKIKHLAYSENNLTVKEFNNIKNGINIDCQPYDECLQELRQSKNDWEIKQILNALECAQNAFRISKNNWQVGMTEKEVKLDLEYQMYKHGAEELAFETIVAVNDNASLPHAHAGERKIKAGALLLIDFGARINGYNSDLTRTMWFGDINKEWLKRYKLVLEAQLKAIKEIKAGVGANVPDEKARKIFAKENVEKLFGHSLGHGVGIEIHEYPRLSKYAKYQLKEGQVVTVEPGLYFPKKGGIRIEDMVVVDKDKARVLSNLEKNEEDIVI